MSELSKKFEGRVKSCFLQLPGFKPTIDRLKDPAWGQQGVRNVCDFIGYQKPIIYYIEAKTIKDKSINFADIPQYEDLLEKIDIPGAIAGIIVWYYDLGEEIYWYDIQFAKYVREVLKEKSLGLRHNCLTGLDGIRGPIKIPCKIKRVYPEMDLSVIAKGVNI